MTNSPSFQATLDISKVKSNKARWQNIANIFSKKTKTLPEVMKVIEHEKDTVIKGPATFRDILEMPTVEALAFNSTISELLQKNSDETVAKKLIKLLNIGSVADSRKEKAGEIFERKMDTQSWVARDEFQEQLEKEFEAIEIAARNKANKDAFLRNFEIIV